MRPYIAELSKISDTYICVYPNAGLPNPMADTWFDETAADTSSLLEEFARAGLVNVDGGCCGTTSETTKAVAARVQVLSPRHPPFITAKPHPSGRAPPTTPTQHPSFP